MITKRILLYVQMHSVAYVWRFFKMISTGTVLLPNMVMELYATTPGFLLSVSMQPCGGWRWDVTHGRQTILICTGDSDVFVLAVLVAQDLKKVLYRTEHFQVPYSTWHFRGTWIWNGVCTPNVPCVTPCPALLIMANKKKTSSLEGAQRPCWHWPWHQTKSLKM